MSKRKKIISVAIFLITIVAGIVFILEPGNKNNITSGLFTVKNTSEVSKIEIIQNSEKVDLTKQNKNWTIDGKYPANKEAVKKLCQLLTETKISKPVLKSKKDSLKNMLINKGKIIKIYGKDNELIKELRVGDYNKQIKGTYMLNPAAPEPFAVNIPGVDNDLNYRWNTNSVYWLNPEIFSYKPNEINEITIKYTNTFKKSFQLKISGDTAFLFNLSDNFQVQNINLKKTGSYLSYFMNVKFTSETSGAEKIKRELLKKKEFADITVKDIYGNTKNVKLYKIKSADNKGGFDLNKLYAVINSDDVVIVKYIDFDLILKDINYFIN